MSYSIDSLPLSSFVTKSIDMPRFQRGNKWSAKQKIELAISIFKKYPLGSVIFCVEKENNEVTKNYLIDGRQRHTAIKQICQNPDLIYTWARSYLSLSDEPDLAQAFWKKVKEYTNYDANERSDDESDEQEAQSDSSQSGTKEDDNNLKTLLQIILMCHDSDTHNNGLTKNFDFKPFILNVAKYERRLISRDYADKRKIDCGSLKSYLYDYLDDCKRQNKDYKIKENFIQYIDDSFTFKDDSKKNKCRDELFGFWEQKQLVVFDIFKKIDLLLDNSKIATITVEDVPPSDEQKIFNVINTNGTPLTAAEVLSAKPSWNKLIDSRRIDEEIIANIKRLYEIVLENKDGCNNGYVKWDLPASLLMSLKNFSIFFPVKTYLQKYLDHKEDKQAKIITLGFKIISGYCNNGKIKKDNLGELGSNDFINPDSISEFKNKFNRMLLTINEFKYFKTLASWQLSLSTLIGDTPTIYFLLCALFMFEKFEEPTATANDRKARMFQKDCFILIDEIIYEYSNGVWKGSSDSLLESKLPAFKTSFRTDAPINHISSNDWKNLINDIIENGKIKTKDISLTLIKPLITHYYCISNISNHLQHEFVTEFDHIIPQEKFSDFTAESRSKINMNNLYNIGLLPKTTNAAKGKKILTELLGNEVLKNNVIKYEEIEENRFVEFSDPNNLHLLKGYRAPKIKTAFEDKRNEILGN